MTREAVGVSGVILLFLCYLCFQAAYPAVIVKNADTAQAVYFLNHAFTSHRLKIAAVILGIFGCLCLVVMIATTGKNGSVVLPWSNDDSEEASLDKPSE